MKRVLLVIIFITTYVGAYAQVVRDADEALKMAQEFWPKKKGAEQSSQVLAYEEKEGNHPYYYVFNRGNNEGFVIICADKRVRRILGYSDTGSFDISAIPEHMRSWLNVYKEELKDLAITPDSLLKVNYGQFTLSKARKKGSQSFAPAVKPLLGNINFDQSYPYNGYCPQNCVTGCVATAAAQLMRYYQYPKQPSRKPHSYTWNGTSLGSNFNTPYDWANMLPTYGYNGQGATQRQAEAVALLMYEAGVSCDMSYGASSAANSMKMCHSLVEYFGYDEGIMGYPRDAFTEADWVFYLKRELNSGRPVFMCGQGNNGGHAFVCDGYDSNGLFHINWGWNGKSNGYFSISNLNPSALGAGGGSGAYNRDVWFIGGIRPKQGGKKAYLLSTNGLTVNKSFGRNQQFQFSPRRLTNSSMFEFNGTLGVALYKDGKFFKVIAKQAISKFPEGNWFDSFEMYATIPRDVKNGTYQMVPVFQAQGDTEWHAVLSGTCNCTDVNITSTNVTMEFNYKDHFNEMTDDVSEVVPQPAPTDVIVPPFKVNPINDNVMPGEDFVLFGGDNTKVKEEEDDDNILPGE